MSENLTAQEALVKWDKGQLVPSVEMGGLGPGYEQCIHVLVFEIIRDNEPLPPADADGKISLREWSEKAVARADKHIGFSGAQVGAAKSLAFRFIQNGVTKTVESVEEDRRISVSKDWPHIPEPSDVDKE